MNTTISFKSVEGYEELLNIDADSAIPPPPGTYWHHGLITYQVREVHLDYVYPICNHPCIPEYRAVWTVYVSPCADPREAESK